MTVIGNQKDTIVSMVLDSAPLIKKINLFSLAQNFYTIPEVIAEIRDKQAREQLENSLIDLKIKIPSEEAISAVTSFAKKTGDLATLSKTDIRVIALTWMLEKEAGNLDKIRKEPITSKVQYGNKKSKKSKSKGKIEKDEKDENDTVGSFNENINWEKELEEIIEKEFDSEDSLEFENQDENEEENNVEINENNNLNENEKKDETENTTVENKDNKNNEIENKEDDNQEEDDDDNEGWITPDNISQYHAKELGIKSNKNREPKTFPVACMTADFAMQNVLLQMNLKISSVDGMIITRLKNWVLRCHACYYSTSDMSKKFCPQCGHNTLIRTSVSIDKYGNKIFHLKKNFNYRIRGTKYSIPKFEGGHHSSNIILSEDQSEYQKAYKQQKFKQKKEKVVDLLDPDYINTLFGGSNSTNNRGSKGRNNLYNDYTGDIIVGYGRKNPNERRRNRK